jgi:23S rRNA pseudouridine1911/1915/1917 synthase
MDPIDEDEDPPTTHTISIDGQRAGERLDRVLADVLADLSRNRVQALIRDGQVRASGERTVSDASERVKPGTVYEVSVPPPEPAAPKPQDIPLAIVFEDADLIVVDKPAGLVVHPGAGNRDGTLVNALLHHCGGSLVGIGGVSRPGIVHRIDKDTSGLLVVAKSDRAHAGLSDLFARHAVDRRYRAIALGLPEPLRGTIDQPIARHPTDRIRFATTRADRGKAAITHYRVLAQSDIAAAEVECVLETGRTHQIRVHMASIGHPLVGDPLYGAPRRGRPRGLEPDAARAVEAFPRQALHARVLGFDHPVTGETLHFTSPEPDDYRALREALGLSRTN